MATSQKFRKPAHTEVDSIDGRVLVSTIHIGRKGFETMVFPLIDGEPDTNTELAQRKVFGEGAADEQHRNTCQKFDKTKTEYVFEGIGKYKPKYISTN